MGGKAGKWKKRSLARPVETSDENNWNSEDNKTERRKMENDERNDSGTCMHAWGQRDRYRQTRRLTDRCTDQHRDTQTGRNINCMISESEAIIGRMQFVDYLVWMRNKAAVCSCV